MKRSGIKPKPWAASWKGATTTYTPRPRTPAPASQMLGDITPAPKNPPWRSEGYRRWVAGLPCARCGREVASQAAHADSTEEGKGMGIKSDDRTCMPLCADGPGRVGCHTNIGCVREQDREARRAEERRLGAETRAQAMHTIWCVEVEDYERMLKDVTP